MGRLTFICAEGMWLKLGQTWAKIGACMEIATLRVRIIQQKHPETSMLEALFNNQGKCTMMVAGKLAISSSTRMSPLL